MSFFNYAIKKSEDDRRFREQQQALQSNPFYTLSQSFAQAVPSAGLQIAGNLIQGQAKHHLFGGKKMQDHQIAHDYAKLASEDEYRRFLAAKESPTRRAAFEAGVGGVSVPDYARRAGYGRTGQPGRESTFQRAQMPGQKQAVSPAARQAPPSGAQPLPDPLPKPESLNEILGSKFGGTDSQEEAMPPVQIPTYRQVAESRYPALQNEYATDYKNRQFEVGRLERNLREDGRKKLISFNNATDKVMERFEDRGVLRNAKGRKAAIENIVNSFSRRLSSLPPQERQSAYNHLLSRANVALGTGDVAEAEKLILGSRYGGRVRQYTVSGNKSTRINYYARRENEKAFRNATFEREKATTNLNAINKAIQSNLAKADKEKDADKLQTLKEQYVVLQAQKQQQEQLWNFHNNAVNDAFASGQSGKQKLNPKPYMNPITGKMDALGATFMGTGSNQPAVTRQENLTSEALNAINSSNEMKRVIYNNLLFENPLLYQEVVASPNPDLALAETIGSTGNPDLLKKPTASEQKRRKQQDVSIVNNMKDSDTFNQVTTRFPDSRNKQSMQNLLAGGDLNDREVREAAIYGRLAGVEGSITDDRFNRISNKLPFVTPNNYATFTEDFKDWLDENKGRGREIIDLNQAQLQYETDKALKNYGD